MGYNDLTVEKSRIIPDVLIIRPSMSIDLRGNIYTSYKENLYKKLLPATISFIHDKFAESKFNVLRGLHGDTKTWKLVSCVSGNLFEVVVDMREESPTFKKWDSFELSGDQYSQILIPPRFVNGYYVRSEKAVFHYKLAYDGSYIDADEQMTFRWDDPQFNIEWPCKEPILQERDKLK